MSQVETGIFLFINVKRFRKFFCSIVLYTVIYDIKDFRVGRVTSNRGTFFDFSILDRISLRVRNLILWLRNLISDIGLKK